MYFEDNKIPKHQKIIFFLILIIVLLLGYIIFNFKKQQDLQILLLRNLEYKTSIGNGEVNSKQRDPYKEIAVINSLRKKASQIQECYKVYLSQKPALKNGTVEIDWIILEDGHVDRAEIVKTELESKSFQNCILNTVSSIVFPKPPTGIQTYITYKYNFKMENGSE